MYLKTCVSDFGILVGLCDLLLLCAASKLFIVLNSLIMLLFSFWMDTCDLGVHT